jgi:hypothetical protein
MARIAAAALLLAVALMAAAALGARPAPARAAETAADSVGAVRDTTARTERKVKPFFVMARSAVVPGWGQVYNRQPLKAVVVVAGEAFLVHKIFQELGRQNDAIDRRAAAASNGDAVGDSLAVLDEGIHKNRKIDWIWWTAAAHLLQMADAYVDAHFINFDAEFGPDDDRIAAGSRAAPRLRLALQVKF